MIESTKISFSFCFLEAVLRGYCRLDYVIASNNPRLSYCFSPYWEGQESTKVFALHVVCFQVNLKVFVLQGLKSLGNCLKQKIL